MVKQDFLVQACLLALASNLEPDHNLNFAIKQIENYGQLWLSDVIVSEPIVSENNTIPVYQNLMGYLILHTPLAYYDFINLTKQIEQLANRDDFVKPWVSLDVDVVAIQTMCDISQLTDEKNQCFIDLTNHWYAIARRFPLASYDKTCFVTLTDKLTHNLSPNLSMPNRTNLPNAVIANILSNLTQ